MAGHVPYHDYDYVQLTLRHTPDNMFTLWGHIYNMDDTSDHIYTATFPHGKSYHFGEIFVAGCSNSCHLTTFGAASDENVVKTSTFLL